jgi:hypothetical protein
MLKKCPMMIAVEKKNIPYSKISARSSNTIDTMKPLNANHKKILKGLERLPLVTLYIDKKAIRIKRHAMIGLVIKPTPIAKSIGTVRQ